MSRRQPTRPRVEPTTTPLPATKSTRAVETKQPEVLSPVQEEQVLSEESTSQNGRRRGAKTPSRDVETVYHELEEKTKARNALDREIQGLQREMHRSAKSGTRHRRNKEPVIEGGAVKQRPPPTPKPITAEFARFLGLNEALVARTEAVRLFNKHIKDCGLKMPEPYRTYFRVSDDMLRIFGLDNLTRPVKTDDGQLVNRRILDYVPEVTGPLLDNTGKQVEDGKRKQWVYSKTRIPVLQYKDVPSVISDQFLTA